MAGDVFVAHRSTVNAAEADATFSSFWQSVETATPGFTFPPDNGIPLLTTTSVANPIVSAYLPASIKGNQLNGLLTVSELKYCSGCCYF